MLPLDGITVVTLEHAIAAPFCTRQLADLGARVIKVERPVSGDFARAYDSRVKGLASHFVWANGPHYAFFNALGLDTTGMTSGPTTPDLEWQTWIIYSAIPLGSSLMCFRFLQVAWNFHRTGELPHHDHGHVEGIDEVTPHDVNPAKT